MSFLRLTTPGVSLAGALSRNSVIAAFGSSAFGKMRKSRPSGHGRFSVDIDYAK